MWWWAEDSRARHTAVSRQAYTVQGVPTDGTSHSDPLDHGLLPDPKQSPRTRDRRLGKACRATVVDYRLNQSKMPNMSLISPGFALAAVEVETRILSELDSKRYNVARLHKVRNHPQS